MDENPSTGSPAIGPELPSDNNVNNNPLPSEPASPASPREPALPTLGRDIAPAPSSAPNDVVTPDTDKEAAASGSEKPTVFLPPKKKNKLLTLLIVVIIVVLAVGGGAYYWSTRQQKKNNSNTSTQTSTKKDVSLIRYGVVEGPINKFYPDTSTSTEGFEVNEQIFEGLVRYENQTKLVPLLATSWTNPDQNTWIFKLKQGVKFHTGRTMTAQDVKDSIEGSKNSDFGKLFGPTIKTVTVIDDNTVKIVTDGPDPILLNRLAFLWIYDTKSGKKNDPINGTGAYVVKSGTTPTDKLLNLVAFDNYHGGHAYTRALDFIQYANEDALVAALKSNSIDIGGYIIDGKNVTQVQQAGYEPFSVDGLQLNHVGFDVNKAGSPVAKLLVRQAIYYALDPKAIYEADGANGKIASQIVPESIPGYNKAITRPALDRTKAKQLLTQAGYPNGITITLSYATPAEKVANEIKSELSQVGVTVKLDGTDVDSFINNLFEGKTEFYFVGFSSDLLDLSDVYSSLFQSKNYHNPAIDKTMDEANKTLDPAKRLALLQQTTKALSDDVAVVPLYTRISTWAINKNYVIQKDYANSDLGALFWRVYQN